MNRSACRLDWQALHQHRQHRKRQSLRTICWRRRPWLKKTAVLHPVSHSRLTATTSPQLCNPLRLTSSSCSDPFSTHSPSLDSPIHSISLPLTPPSPPTHTPAQPLAALCLRVPPCFHPHPPFPPSLAAQPPWPSAAGFMLCKCLEDERLGFPNFAHMFIT